MTNETVIAILSELKKCYLGGIVDALDFAIEAVKMQEPQVMTLEEVKSYWQNREIAFLVEHNDLSDPVWMIYYGYLSALKEIVFIDGIDHMHNYGIDGYGIDWRVWTSRPSDEVREATPWET